MGFVRLTNDLRTLFWCCINCVTRNIEFFLAQVCNRVFFLLLIACDCVKSCCRIDAVKHSNHSFLLPLNNTYVLHSCDFIYKVMVYSIESVLLMVRNTYEKSEPIDNVMVTTGRKAVRATEDVSAIHPFEQNRMYRHFIQTICVVLCVFVL